MLIITSSLAGFQFALMTRLTHSLYMAMGYHFVNNVIANILHVVSGTGADQFMVVRISIAQTVSFVIILSRRPKKSFYWYQKVIETNGEELGG